MWSYNETNGLMTTVVPELILLAGNWNNNVFPTLVPITTTMGLWCFMMACNIGSYNPRNWASLPNIFSNSAWMSTPRNRFHQANCASYISSSYTCRFLLALPLIPTPWCADGNPKKQCHTGLTRRNFSRRLIMELLPSINSLA